ncbi:MAG: helix-turn-helix transcriptional regulator [Anaerolineaceae bacterium]|nr:helix-turn-helix transcriptional regulator [Anaerolineaceae bacterium]
MIDYDKIGKRILEERKYLHRISQEKMAQDLGMYQADISNLEKAKKGSGITDLSKLDIIADYFDMPLEILLFGRRQDQMEKYTGSKMQLKHDRCVDKCIRVSHFN